MEIDSLTVCVCRTICEGSSLALCLLPFYEYSLIVLSAAFLPLVIFMFSPVVCHCEANKLAEENNRFKKINKIHTPTAKKDSRRLPVFDIQRNTTFVARKYGRWKLPFLIRQS